MEEVGLFLPLLRRRVKKGYIPHNVDSDRWENIIKITDSMLKGKKINIRKIKRFNSRKNATYLYKLRIPIKYYYLIAKDFGVNLNTVFGIRQCTYPDSIKLHIYSTGDRFRVYGNNNETPHISKWGSCLAVDGYFSYYSDEGIAKVLYDYIMTLPHVINTINEHDLTSYDFDEVFRGKSCGIFKFTPLELRKLTKKGKRAIQAKRNGKTR